ncbi:MAG: 3-oxoacyl-[acyl-carrier-protein] reductase [Lachnospiraceae bacterium]|nr:3-oxoacyl-[acyl-carrier-protein] reductase [Lachnospiraceae bacterium]
MSNNEPMLKNKVAVVTGGSRGIGRAICEAFCKNGADVAFLDAGSVETAEETAAYLSTFGTKVKAYMCDISDFAKTSEVFKEILAEFGTVDILVNNAGITRDKLLLSMKPEEFTSVIDINLVGAYNTVKQVYPVMIKKRSGKIVNISSVSGIMGNAGQTNYSASKAGIIGFTKSIAKEVASRGICCNAVAPGFVSTSMTTAFAENEALVSSIPMHRFAKPEEIADLVLFLSSDKADYITGEVIRIDGGLAM